MTYEELEGYCTVLEEIVMDRGISADRLIRGDRAMVKLERLREMLAEDDTTLVAKTCIMRILKDGDS